MRANMAFCQKKTHAKRTHAVNARRHFPYVDVATRCAAQDDSFFLFRRSHARSVMILLMHDKHDDCVFLSKKVKSY